MLHDVIEDCITKNYTREMLEQRIASKFGDDVLDTVLAVTHRKHDDDGEEAGRTLRGGRRGLTRLLSLAGVVGPVAGRLVDSQWNDKALEPYRLVDHVSIEDIPCRPARVTLRMGRTGHATVFVPAKGGANAS